MESAGAWKMDVEIYKQDILIKSVLIYTIESEHNKTVVQHYVDIFISISRGTFRIPLDIAFCQFSKRYLYGVQVF